jgi:hypothetical protein
MTATSGLAVFAMGKKRKSVAPIVAQLISK